MEGAPQMRFDYYVLLSHSTVRKVLLVDGEEGWGLPRWTCGEALWWPNVGALNRAMREQLGVKVTTLRCVHAERGATKQGERVYWMENHSPGWSPPAGARWIGREELEGLTLAQSGHSIYLEDWFEDAVSPFRPAWERPGEFAEMTCWIEEQMERLGLTPVGRIEQQKIWTLSAILRIETSGGTLYFKAVPEMFRAEAQLTGILSEFYPEHSPGLIARDEARGWMLMRDMGGTPLRQVADVAKTEEALRLYARMQREMETRAEALLALGCRDRRLERLVGQVAPLLADTAVLRSRHSNALSEGEVNQLRALESQLPVLCERLAEHRIPATLEHGDFHSGNIMVTEPNLLFFDWTDGSVSHPFFSMFTLLEEGDIEKEERERLRDIYLDAWTDRAPMEGLREAYDLAQTLGALYHALSYYWIVQNTEPSSLWQWEDVPAYYLRAFLQRMAQSAP
jgi:hypothetical protein